jgi:putative NADPH-quinone reductase
MQKKILVILAHPARASLCGALAEAYGAGAREAGAKVRELSLTTLRFDPVLPPNGEGGAPLEPDLVQAQQDILWAEHLVFVYPILWGTIPALLKGFIERSFLPGFAVNFRKNSPLWDKLLAGRSARLIVTMNTPSLIYRLFFGRTGHVTMRKAVLNFCGITPVHITEMASVQRSSPEKRQRWLTVARELGRRQQ